MHKCTNKKRRFSLKKSTKLTLSWFFFLGSGLWFFCGIKVCLLVFFVFKEIKFSKQPAPFTSDLPLELDSVCFDFSKIRISNVRIKDRCCLNGFSKKSFKKKTSIKHPNIIFQKPSESMALKWFCCNLKGIWENHLKTVRLDSFSIASWIVFC